MGPESPWERPFTRGGLLPAPTEECFPPLLTQSRPFFPILLAISCEKCSMRFDFSGDDTDLLFSAGTFTRVSPLFYGLDFVQTVAKLQAGRLVTVGDPLPIRVPLKIRQISLSHSPTLNSSGQYRLCGKTSPFLFPTGPTLPFSPPLPRLSLPTLMQLRPQLLRGRSTFSSTNFPRAGRQLCAPPPVPLGVRS